MFKALSLVSILVHWGGQVEDDSLQVDWLTKVSGLLALGGAESIFMSVLLVKQILTAYYLPLEGSEEDIVAQHRHMIHMEAVITAVSSHRNTWSDKTAGQIRSLSALRSPPSYLSNMRWRCRRRHLMFVSLSLLILSVFSSVYSKCQLVNNCDFSYLPFTCKGWR